MGYCYLRILHRFDQNLTGKIYSNEILLSYLLHSISSMGIEFEDFLFQEDLDPKNSLNCKLSECTAKEMGYHIIQDWLPSIPDLNSLE
jgi:hypothetical protein